MFWVTNTAVFGKRRCDVADRTGASVSVSRRRAPATSHRGVRVVIHFVYMYALPCFSLGPSLRRRRRRPAFLRRLFVHGPPPASTFTDTFFFSQKLFSIVNLADFASPVVRITATTAVRFIHASVVNVLNRVPCALPVAWHYPNKTWV